MEKTIWYSPRGFLNEGLFIQGKEDIIEEIADRVCKGYSYQWIEVDKPDKGCRVETAENFLNSITY